MKLNFRFLMTFKKKRIWDRILLFQYIYPKMVKISKKTIDIQFPPLHKGMHCVSLVRMESISTFLRFPGARATYYSVGQHLSSNVVKECTNLSYPFYRIYFKPITLHTERCDDLMGINPAHIKDADRVPWTHLLHHSTCTLERRAKQHFVGLSLCILEFLFLKDKRYLGSVMQIGLKKETLLTIG
jgi:hypothetical protein